MSVPLASLVRVERMYSDNSAGRELIAPSVLPPGQHPVPARRFGLPQSARWKPSRTPEALLEVGGQVRFPIQLAWADLAATAARRQQCSDLHCVTTWSTVGLRWGGWPFADVLSELIRRVQPVAGVQWLTLSGHDGYRSCLYLDDAMDDQVLLADELDGQPLPFAHGAPLRLVPPDHYGYKSVKHLRRIDFRTTYEAGSAGWGEHPRARVSREERSCGLPGWLYRPVWRSLAPLVLRAYRRQQS